MEGIFSKTLPPSLWKFQLCFIHFFKCFGLTEPPPPRKFQSLLWGEYGYFLELHIKWMINENLQVFFTISKSCYVCLITDWHLSVLSALITWTQGQWQVLLFWNWILKRLAWVNVVVPLKMYLMTLLLYCDVIIMKDYLNTTATWGFAVCGSWKVMDLSSTLSESKKIKKIKSWKNNRQVWKLALIPVKI